MRKAGLNRISSLLTVLLAIQVSYAQTYWARSYGTNACDEMRSVAATADGGFVVCGNVKVDTAGTFEACVLKFNAAAQLEWKQRFTGSNKRPLLRSIRQTRDGGYIAAGSALKYMGSNKPYRTDAWIIRLDSKGKIKWQRSYGTTHYRDRIDAIIESSDGGFAACGSIADEANDYSDAWFIRLDANGELLWQKRWGSEGEDALFDLVETWDGGFATCGVMMPDGSVWADAWLVRLSSTGDVLWQKAYGSTDWDVAFSLITLPNKGFVMAGEATLGTQGRDAWLCQTSQTGQIVWQKSYRGNGGDWFMDVAAISGGGYVVAGRSDSFGTEDDAAWVVRTDASGKATSQKVIGGSVWDSVSQIIALASGGFVTVGDTESHARGSCDGWILKLDNSGALGSSCQSLVGNSNSKVVNGTAKARNTNVPTIDPAVSKISFTAAQKSFDPGEKLICGSEATDGHGPAE